MSQLTDNAFGQDAPTGAASPGLLTVQPALAALRTSDDPLLAVRSRTRLPTGLPLWPQRVWLVLQGGQLVLLAAGRRPLQAAAPLSDLSDSRYNHVTGELLLAPGPTLPVHAIRISPLQADEILRRIANEVTFHA